jgi:predicted RNA methylase
LQRKKAGGICEVLDAGSGSSLLAMMAARHGADFVAAVEQKASMVDAGEENVCMNGLAHKVLCVNRDVRRVFTRESDGVSSLFFILVCAIRLTPCFVYSCNRSRARWRRAAAG